LAAVEFSVIVVPNKVTATNPNATIFVESFIVLLLLFWGKAFGPMPRSCVE
jgi:hypothetical protein